LVVPEKGSIYVQTVLTKFLKHHHFAHTARGLQLKELLIPIVKKRGD
jgi:hypothetical protein